MTSESLLAMSAFTIFHNHVGFYNAAVISKDFVFVVIEQLPQDLRDRFTEMRELDLKVQSMIDFYIV